MTAMDKTKIIERYFGGWSVQQLIKDYQAHILIKMNKRS